MIVKLIILLLFNITYLFNNYNDIVQIIILNAIFFLCDYLLVKVKFKLNFKKIILSVLLALVLILINKNSFLCGYKDSKITVNKLDNNVVKIKSIYLNNEKQKLSDGGSDPIILYDIYNKIDDSYSLDLKDSYNFFTNKAKIVTINFEKNNYDYSVLVNDDVVNVPSSVIDNKGNFYKAFDNYYTYKVDNVNYSNRYIIFNFIISFLALLIFILSILEFMIQKNFIPIFLFLSLILFEYNSLILINFNLKVVLFLGLLLVYSGLYKYKMEIFDKKRILLYLIMGLFSTCFFIGNIFLDSAISFNHVVIFCLFTIFSIYIISFVTCLFKFIMKIILSSSKLKKLDVFLLFCIPLVIFLFYLFIFNPGIITTDATMQIREFSEMPLSNWHPFFHTLVMKFIYNLFGNYQSIIVVRIILIGFVCLYICSYFIKKGVNKKFIYLFLVLFCLNPVVGVYVVSFLKDVDFILFLVLLNFLFIKYVNGDLKPSIFNYILLFLALIFVALFRHNGLYVYIFSLFFIIILSIKNRHFLFTLVSIISIVFVNFINIFLYNKLSVEIGLKNADVVTMAHGLQSIYYYNGDKEVERFFGSIISKDELYDSYSKYNIDVLLHYNSKPFRDVEINKVKLINLYLRKMLVYPDILISDRLYGTDIMWSVFKNDKIETYDYQIFENEFGYNYYSEFGVVPRDSFLKDFVVDVLLFISNNKVLNALLLRSGFYLWLIMILALAFYKKGNWLALLPSILNIVTLFIAMHHQSCRYVMFIPIVFVIYFLHICINNNE